MKDIVSQVFGKITFLDETDKEFEWLKEMIDDYPANAFGILNKKLNNLGFSITVGIKE